MKNFLAQLNIPKPLVKYMTIALSAVIVFFLIYTYVRLTNDRVYEIANEQSANNTEQAGPTLRHDTDSKLAANTDITGAITTPEQTSATEESNGKRFVAGKNPRICMRELHTNVINNDVVRCTHDHFE